MWLAKDMGQSALRQSCGAPPGASCSCNPDSCVNDPRAEHVIVSTSQHADGGVQGHCAGHFVAPRQRARSVEAESVIAREDGGVCIGDINGSAGTIRYLGGEVYTGEWRNTRANGYGRVVRPDSSTYEGQWNNDTANGEGTETFVDSSWYRGGYVQGVKAGFGIFHWTNGPQFCGQFEDNVFHGEGTYQWGDGRLYTGQWCRNEFHGHGRMSWPDGQVYDGQYASGRKDGEGTFIWTNGRRFTGSWKDGKQHGLGIFCTDKAQQRAGEWVDGRRIRWVEEKSMRDAVAPGKDIAAEAEGVEQPQ